MMMIITMFLLVLLLLTITIVIIVFQCYDYLFLLCFSLFHFCISDRVNISCCFYLITIPYKKKPTWQNKLCFFFLPLIDMHVLTHLCEYSIFITHSPSYIPIPKLLTEENKCLLSHFFFKFRSMYHAVFSVVNLGNRIRCFISDCIKFFFFFWFWFIYWESLFIFTLKASLIFFQKDHGNAFVQHYVSCLVQFYVS